MLINNQAVDQRVKTGRSADYITASIKHAPGTRFDLSAPEVLKLRRDGVSKRVLNAMAKSQLAHRQSGGRWRAVVYAVAYAVALLWWVPLVFGW